MADHTCFKDLPAAQKQLGYVSTPGSASMAEATRVTDLQKAQQKLDQILQSASMKRTAAKSEVQAQIAGAFYQTSGGQQHVHGKKLDLKIWPPSKYVHSSLPRIDFPRFDGSNPRAWMFKCNSFFKLMPNIHDAQRIHLASMHFDGRALAWFQDLNMVELGITWKQFLEVVSSRFEMLPISHIVMEFNELKQNGSYDDYVERFEELSASLLLHDSSRYSEEYLIAHFMSGLSEELQSFLHMSQPRTLADTIELGRKQLTTFDAIARKMKSPSRVFLGLFDTYKRNELVPLPTHVTAELPPTKLLTSSEMAARIEKGLCSNCDEPFVRGHRCKQRINYVLMTEEEELLEAQDITKLVHQDAADDIIQSVDEVPISLHSMMGDEGVTTMRVVKEVGDHKLIMLLDTGLDAHKVFSPLTEAMSSAQMLVPPHFKRSAAHKAIESGIPDVESNMVQMVKEVHQFYKLLNAQEVATLENPNTGEDLAQNLDEMPMDEIFILQDTNKKGDIPPDLIPKLEKNVAIFEEQAGLPPARGMENHMTLKFGSLPMHQNEVNHFLEEMLRRCLGKKYIYVEYANMLFTATLKGGTVTLQALPNEPFLTNLTHEGITDFGDIFVEETAIEHDKSTILLRVFTETSTIGEENGKTQFGVGDMVSLKFHHLHLPFVFRIGKEIVPTLQYCEDAAAGASVLGTRVVTGKVNTILQNFEGIPLGIMLVAESGVAFLGCNTQTFVHELSKIEPLLVMGTHILNREDKKFGQMLLHGLNARLESAIWELTQFLRRKISPFNPCGQGSFEAGGIVMALVKEKGEEVEVAGGKEKKLGRKADLGKKVGDVFELEKVGGWLISESAFAMSRDLDLISHKLPSLDPRGRGSSAARGIVMSGDSEEYEGLLREYELGMI